MKKALIFSIMFITIICAQNTTKKYLSDVKQIVNKASITMQEKDILKAKNICQRILSKEPNNQYSLYYSAYTDYLLMMIKLKESDANLENTLFNSAIDKCKKINQSNLLSEVNALLANLYMMKLAITPQQAPMLSMKVHEYANKSIAMDKNNPRVYLVKAIMLFKTPRQFGGNLDAAIDQLSDAISLFSIAKKDSLLPDWGFLQSIAWLGQMYEAKGNYKSAKATYEKALKIEPNYGWVKYVLLPALNNKTNKSRTNK